MAHPSLKLIRAIRNTSGKLIFNAPYQWGHMGSCNCGHLAQEITRVSKADIHSFAMHSEGSWTDQSRNYCPTSGLPMDLLISSMLDFGLQLEDLGHLEKLSDPEILKFLGVRKLRYNNREDVILYLESWADLLEKKLLSEISLVALSEVTKPDRANEPNHPSIL
ncbi:MAG: hypothetical protein DHS20C17_08360 [Cyclobacteriaceae bacterium]|nr:MAG: hypothetical protein DHS20C17_08360 [Cyclobacteriaceae bacterium]